VADQATEGHGESPSVTELLEQLARELGQLGLYQSQLEAVRNVPAVRRALRDGAGALVALLALLAAFAFANVAAFAGLTTTLSSWEAALVLTGFWLLAGVLLVLGVAGRIRQSRVWKALASSSPEAAAQLEQLRDNAAQAVRDTVGVLGPAITIEVVAATVPSAGGVVEGALDAGDEVVEALVEDIPGGGAINQIWDVALIPGRFGLRVAATIFRRDGTDN
jgi:hypothetical protein